MRVRSVVVFPMILFISGCEPSPRDRLQGKWVGEEVQEIHPSQQGRAAGWARGTRLEFAGNKVTVAVPAESPRTGTFKVAKVDKQGLEVVFRRPEGGEDRSHFAFSDDGRLLWTLGGGVQLVMRKE